MPFCPTCMCLLRDPLRKEAGLCIPTQKMRKQALGEVKQITQPGRGRPGMQFVALDTNKNRKGQEGEDTPQGRCQRRATLRRWCFSRALNEKAETAMQTWVCAACRSRGARPRGCIQSLAARQGCSGHDLSLTSSEQPYLSAWFQGGCEGGRKSLGFGIKPIDLALKSLAAHQHVAVDKLLSPHLPRGFRHPSWRDCCEALSSCSRGASQASGYRQVLQKQRSCYSCSHHNNSSHSPSAYRVPDIIPSP